MKTFEDSAVLGKFNGTSQQEADALLAEHQANKAGARHHLASIETGGEMVSRHARALAQIPPWGTASIDEMKDAEAELERALYKVRDAMIEYYRKPRKVISNG